jgi:hypothetical protein
MSMTCIRFRVSSLSLVALLQVTIVASALAKRAPPAAVAPVDAGGVRIVVNHFDNACRQVGGCVEIVERKTSELIRAVTVYTVKKDPKLESDVQDIFITELHVEGRRVIVHDEAGRAHSFDL